MSIKRKHKQTIIAIILALINFWVKGFFLSSNSLAGDEPFSVYHAQMDIPSIIRLLSEGNNPPLYEILLHFWINIFGISEFSVRFPSLIFSSLTVFYIYQLGIKYLNQRIALYSSIIFIFSNFHILFAHEARVYSLLGLLSVASMYYFMGIIQYCNEGIDKDKKLNATVRKKIIILVIINTLIIYSHYFGFFILITQFIYFVSNKSLMSKCWKQLCLILLILGLLYLPNIFVFFNRFIESSTSGTWVNPPNGIDGLYNMIRKFSNAPVVAVYIIIIFVISLVKLTINKKREKKNIYNRLLIFWFVFIFFFMFSISYKVPMFLDRYLMPAAVAFVFVIAISSDYIVKNTKYRYLIPTITILIFLITVKPNITNKRNVKETVAKIKEIKTENTIVYFCPSWFEMNFTYYFDIACFENYSTNDLKKNIYKCLNNDNIYLIDNSNQIDTLFLENFDKVIYLDAGADFSFPKNGILKKLESKYTLEDKYFYNDIFNIYEFKIK